MCTVNRYLCTDKLLGAQSMAAALTLSETRMPSGRTLEPDLVLTSSFMISNRTFGE